MTKKEGYKQRTERKYRGHAKDMNEKVESFV